jgi:hypothetical protein
MAVSSKFKIPLVRFGFQTTRKLRHQRDLDRKPKELGMCDTTMSQLMLFRIVQACVPGIGEDVDLTEEEGTRCTERFKKGIEGGSVWAKRFDAADGARTLRSTLPGCWNRVVSLYLNVHNNENVENVQVALALDNYQRKGELPEAWADRMDSILLSVDNAEKNNRVTLSLSKLLLPGWLQDNMQSFVSIAQEKADKLTYAEYMQKLRSKAPNDPKRLQVPRGVREPEVQPPRARFKVFRTPAERSAFAQVRQVQAREEGQEITSVCNRCHQVGHWARDCTSRGGQPFVQPAAPAQQTTVRPTNFQRKDGVAGTMQPNRKCAACGNTGHEPRDCPRRAPAGRGRPPR